MLFLGWLQALGKRSAGWEEQVFSTSGKLALPPGRLELEGRFFKGLWKCKCSVLISFSKILFKIMYLEKNKIK